MINQEQVTEQDDEISLFDIADFFITHAKTILITGFLGLMTAGLYFWFTTSPQYEATALIQMAQLPTNKHLGVVAGNVEDAGTLISRLALPTTYSSQNIQACKLENVKIDQDLALSKKLKYSIIKNAPNVVEIKVSQNSKDDAITCLKSVFETIAVTQNKIAEPLRSQATQLIEEKNKKLALAKELLLREGKSGLSLSTLYLVTRDEIASFNEDIDSLNGFVNSIESRPTKLISQIYAAETPVSPKKSISLIAGLFGGLCFGIVYIFFRKAMTVFKKYRLEKSAHKS